MSFSGFEAGYVLSRGDDPSLLKGEKIEHLSSSKTFCQVSNPRRAVIRMNHA